MKLLNSGQLNQIIRASVQEKIKKGMMTTYNYDRFRKVKKERNSITGRLNKINEQKLKDWFYEEIDSVEKKADKEELNFYFVVLFRNYIEKNYSKETFEEFFKAFKSTLQQAHSKQSVMTTLIQELTEKMLTTLKNANKRNFILRTSTYVSGCDFSTMGINEFIKSIVEDDIFDTKELGEK